MTVSGNFLAVFFSEFFTEELENGIRSTFRFYIQFLKLFFLNSVSKNNVNLFLDFLSFISVSDLVELGDTLNGTLHYGSHYWTTKMCLITRFCQSGDGSLEIAVYRVQL